MTDLLPCPFCGCEEISLWTGFGTQADISCQSCACERSVQVADMREDGENYPEFDNKTFRYPEWLIERTNKHLIEEWNTRAHLPDLPQRAGWQPYATSPRDGTPILCYWGPSVPGGARAIDVACWIDGNWCDADDAETHFGEPDLWQPLDWPSLTRPQHHTGEAK